MNLTTQFVTDALLEIARSEPRPPRLMAVVGSSSPMNRDVVDTFSDVDVIILTDALDTSRFQARLRDRLTQHWRLIETWDIVSPVVTGGPTVHIHSSNVAAYQQRSSLFRRSVAKYPCLVGSSLAKYAPRSPISCAELLHDQLGINALHAQITDSIDFPEPATRGYSSLIDISLYCALHSARNTLRFLDAYEEFSPVRELAERWERARGPALRSLIRFLDEKERRRVGDIFDVTEERSSAAECCHFLRNVADWLSNTTEQR